MTVLAVDTWKNNAELIGGVARLGYLRHADTVLDPTYGKGRWWKKWRPDPGRGGALVVPPAGTDFRELPYESGTFDAVAYDPPYVCVGGRETSGIKDTYEGYGQLDAPATPEALQELMDAGLAECARVVRPSAVRTLDPTRPNGIILMKCKDYVWSGRFWSGTYRVQQAAERLGLIVEDRLEMVALGAQPADRDRRCGACRGAGCPSCSGTGRIPTRQAHARRNLSTLFVFRRPPR